MVYPRTRGCGPGDVRSPASAIPTLRFEGQLRPAMTPPSTSTMAPGHPARLVRQQERHRVRDVLRAAGSWLRRVPTQVADQLDDVFRYESPDLATRLTLIHKEGRNARCPRVLTDERG